MQGWVRAFVDALGHAGVALLMFIENVFPPIPSEVVMPLAGYLSAEGSLWFPGAVLAGLVGSLLGALPLYGLGHWVGHEKLRSWTARHGHWVGLEPHELDRARRWFEQHGHLTVLLGRLVPGVRSLVSIPAGVCGMRMSVFLGLSALGMTVWVTLLAGIGWWVGDRFTEVGRYLGWASWAVVGGLVVLYVYHVAMRKRRSATSH